MANATPISTAPWKAASTSSPAVAADPSLNIESYSTMEVDVMADLILTEIGGVELSRILRYDALDGVNQVYSPMAQTSRVKPYSSNNLMGQENSRMFADGTNSLNLGRYMNGETSRGVSLSEQQPPSTDVEIQIAIAADWVPFATHSSTTPKEVV